MKEPSHQYLTATLLLYMAVFIVVLSVCYISSFSVLFRPAQQCHAIDIPGLNMHEAVRKLTESTGARLLFAYDHITSQQSRPVQGCLSLQRAIDIMLEGSGLVGAQTGQGIYVIYGVDN